ncbi:MAG: hypothetical protein HY692_05310 [Cyanobacteria bacterium NC_groundwater_1444_Ag_S-0.65um_54_12]|nr:hypothetical protein [Cyanobacteria bacterium NC_groundwater_1444_Ag_S-0.65um_54_12]
MTRFRQVWQYLFERLTLQDLREAALVLSTEEFALFIRMLPPDQAHGARVARRLSNIGAPHPVMVAAYLHDVGKPEGYGLFWRSMLVVWSSFERKRSFGANTRSRWYWAQQIYHFHPEYGALTLIAAGSAPEVIALVRGTSSTAWYEELRHADEQG